jgi:hypothetical protein
LTDFGPFEGEDIGLPVGDLDGEYGGDTVFEGKDVGELDGLFEGEDEGELVEQVISAFLSHASVKETEMNIRNETSYHWQAPISVELIP